MPSPPPSPNRFPPIEADQLSTALCGEICLVYNPPDLAGIVLVYTDGRVLRVYGTPKGEITIQFNRIREEQ